MHIWCFYNFYCKWLYYAAAFAYSDLNMTIAMLADSWAGMIIIIWLSLDRSSEKQGPLGINLFIYYLFNN